MEGTYGEFIDAVRKTDSVEGQLFMDQWVALATKAEWAQYLPMPLDRNLVLPLAEDMASYFREALEGICGDELYRSTMESGHKFLREIHAKADTFGVNMELAEIDTPLSLSDSLGALKPGS